MRSLLILLFSMSLFTSSLMAAEAKNDPHFSFKKKINLSSGPAIASFHFLKQSHKGNNYSVSICRDIGSSYFTLRKPEDNCPKSTVHFDFLCHDTQNYYSKPRSSGLCPIGEPIPVYGISVPGSKIRDQFIAKVVDVSKSQRQCLMTKVKYFKTYLKSKPQLDNWFKKADIEFKIFIENTESTQQGIEINGNNVSFNIKYDETNSKDPCLGISYSPLKNKLYKIREQIEKERIAQLKEKNRDQSIQDSQNMIDSLFSLLDQDSNNTPKPEGNPATVADSETQKEATSSANKATQKPAGKATKG